MIKVNFARGRKAVDIKNVGGFDFSYLNIKLVVLAIIISYVPEFFIYDEYQKNATQGRTEVEKLRKEHGAIVKKKKSLSKYKERFKELKEQKETLNEKIKLISNISTEKKNPVDILYYIAKNIPDNTWLKYLKIEKVALSSKGYLAIIKV